MYMDESQRDELLIRLDERVNAVHKAVMGNGQPGLLVKQAEDRGAIAELRVDMEKYVAQEVDKKASKGGQRFSQVTAAVAFFAAVWQGVNAALKS